MTFGVLLISQHPRRHIVHVETERGAQITARLLAERFPGMAFSYAEGIDLRHGDSHPAHRDSATSFEVRRLVEADLILEAAANPEGLPKWCAFQYRTGGVSACRDQDLRAVEMRRRDFDVVRERAIFARQPSTDELLDRFRMEACDDVADP
jgi:hypothetical protein